MQDQNLTRGGNQYLTSSELSVFCQQVSMILAAGIPLHDGLALLTEDLGDRRLSAVLSQVSAQVSDRLPFSDALDAAGVFPSYLVNMVRIGSDSGRLDEVMSSLSAYYAREDSLRQTIKSAVIYPMALVVMMLLVMMVLSAKVLPVFQQVFLGLGTTMSPIATTIMNLGLAASRYSIALLIIAGILLSAVAYLFRSQQGSQWVARITASGSMSDQISLARFTSSMAMMLASGLDTEHAIKLSSTVIQSHRIKGKVQECILLIEEGTSFLNAITKTELYPQITLRMLSLGFQAGNMDTVMRQAAEASEEEIEASLLRRVSLIEPVSVAFLSILVGMILISVMLPLMSVISSIGS